MFSPIRDYVLPFRLVGAYFRCVSLSATGVEQTSDSIGRTILVKNQTRIVEMMLCFDAGGIVVVTDNLDRERGRKREKEREIETCE